GKIALQRQPVAASQVIAHAMESMRPFIDARGVAVALDIDDPEVVIDVDAARLTQVLSNLLHNAGKYTPAGGHIRVAQRRIGDEIEISVADDGVGISPEFLPYVFELFAQGEQQLDRSEGGLGIGLPLVKRLVEMHGGRVAAESTGRGRGATFRIVLPCAQSAPAQAAADGATDAAGATPRDAAPRRILIVDDNQDAADTLAILLQAEGHEVRTWYSGDGALAQAREFKPHVALLDIGLPGVDGHTLAQALRADSAMHKTLLIALSGYGQREDKERSRAAGFAEHLVKPIDPKVLLARIGAASESG
ncbi:MAG TPA: ATP-binding protein, partial [Burkholderiaceae bacterium]|nr:ATP-binding protein [Burkholderiaceae bacterium]